jgi:hypothetical protein
MGDSYNTGDALNIVGKFAVQFMLVAIVAGAVALAGKEPLDTRIIVAMSVAGVTRGIGGEGVVS